jgi:hypothetical protein
MKHWMMIVAVAALSACGVETATTAATGAAIKKQEVEQGRQTMDQAQARIGEALAVTQQRAQAADGDGGRSPEK